MERRKSFTKNKDRRGQVEIIGLMIVVILIIVGGLIYVKFLMVNDANEGGLERHEDSIRANNLMGAIANIRVCNDEYSIGEMYALIGGGEVCDAKSAENYLSEEIPLIIEATGVKNYRFWVLEGTLVIFDTKGCEYGAKSGSYVLIVDGRQFQTHLRFCSELSTDE
jgi:hypothetical protein